MKKSARKRTRTVPSHLRRATQDWVRRVEKDYVLEAHHWRLLLAAAEMWDRGCAARELIQREGITCPDRYGGTRAHPAVRVELDSKKLFAAILEQLDLDADPPPPPSGGHRLRVAH